MPQRESGRIVAPSQVKFLQVPFTSAAIYLEINIPCPVGQPSSSIVISMRCITYLHIAHFNDRKISIELDLTILIKSLKFPFLDSSPNASTFSKFRSFLKDEL